MLHKKITLLSLVLGLFMFTTSCGEDELDTKTKPSPNPDLMSDKDVNQWIYEMMSIYYLWNNYLPSNPNYNKKPADFYNSICYWYDKNNNPDGDRFSFIQENYVVLMNELSGVVSDEIGFDFSLALMADGESVVGEIEYVKKGTPAAYANLRRGQLFSEINGIALNISNYREILLSLKGDYSIALHDVIVEDENLLLSYPPIEKELSTVPSYKENPLYLDTIYVEGSKKIGYLVYNFFSDDSNDESLSFDIQMIDVFNNFKSEGITDLIVDFRYNSGGALSAATCLSSILVKNRNAKQIFLKAEYNDFLNKEYRKRYGSDYFNLYIANNLNEVFSFNSSKVIPLPSIGNQIDKLVFLTSPNTASASEMVINGLKPHGMDITLVGDTTVGKNVGSVTLYDEEHAGKNKWGIQPIVVKFYNADNRSDFTAGFVPNIVNQGFDYPKKELGDTEESLLADAIAHITGKTVFRNSISQSPMFKPIYSSSGEKAWSNKILLRPDVLPKSEIKNK